jgi:plasmid stability protein
MLSLIASVRRHIVAQLIVRNLEDAVVRALRERAAGKGRSTEAEHREILREALAKVRRHTSLKALLSEMPDAGDDADFARPRAKTRKVRL